MKKNRSRSTRYNRHPDQQSLFPGRTAVDSKSTRNSDCQILSVGKRRDGGTRYWCIQHKADATAKYGKRASICRAAHLPPIAPKEIFELDIDKYQGGVALWGAVPAVYDTTRLPMDRGIHLHARLTPDAKKEMDQTYRAVRLVSHNLPKDGIMVSELDAIYYMVSSVFGHGMKHVACPSCGHAHLDKDWFSVHPHRRHLCAGCGKHFRDSEIGIGNPIVAAHEACVVTAQTPVLSERKLDFTQAEFPGGIQVWGSNPAFLWTSDRPEEEGIHVHAFKHGGTKPDLDETYSEVIIDGIQLDPLMVRVAMAQSAMPSLKDRVRPIACPSCGRPQFDTGELAFTPTIDRKCTSCGRKFVAEGRLRKIIANPLPPILEDLAKSAPRQPQRHELGLMPETL